MKTLEWTTLDKTTWGDGPWQSEPDKRQWQDEATGLPCIAVRNESAGNWCGYVGLPPGHPLHGKSYNDMDVDVHVHGGLTFADTCHDAEDDHSRYVCHLPEPGEPQKVWWFGFDCHHAWDRAPAYDARYKDHPILGGINHDQQYRTLTYVTNQCAALAAQLKPEPSA